MSGKAADTFSFGVMLWQMLTAVRPWAGLRHDQVVEAVAADKKVGALEGWGMPLTASGLSRGHRPHLGNSACAPTCPQPG